MCSVHKRGYGALHLNAIWQRRLQSHRNKQFSITAPRVRPNFPAPSGNAPITKPETAFHPQLSQCARAALTQVHANKFTPSIPPHPLPPAFDKVGEISIGSRRNRLVWCAPWQGWVGVRTPFGDYTLLSRERGSKRVFISGGGCTMGVGRHGKIAALK